MNNTKEILEDMRKITMLTGEISSLHEVNLKKWPYVAFDGVQEVEIKYDLTIHRTRELGEGYVEFHLKIDKQADNSLIKERSEMLTGWVRNMFWYEIKTVVSINDTIVYQNSTIKPGKPHHTVQPVEGLNGPDGD